MKRFESKELLPLESHTSADARSGRIGDIDIVNENGRPFEAIEVKHGIPITKALASDSYEKFSPTQVSRYYLLSTADVKEEDKEEIQAEIERIKKIHGCHVIVNGIYSSLRYYLRMLNDPSDFIDSYADLVKDDSALKFEHKVAWNTINAL